MNKASSDVSGSLIIVGSGIQFEIDFSRNTELQISCADQVFYLTGDALADQRICELAPDAIGLYGYYVDSNEYIDTYNQITKLLVDAVKKGKRVCVVFGGHPSFFVSPTQKASSILRSQGYIVEVYPSVSCIDHLFSDLNYDPGRNGCQIFEATAFLAFSRIPEMSAALILLQIAIIGIKKRTKHLESGPGLAALTEYLSEFYDSSQECIIYEAASYRFCKARIDKIPLGELKRQHVNARSTLFIPQVIQPEIDSGFQQRFGWV